MNYELYIYIYIYIYIIIFSIEAFLGGLMCYGAPSTAFRRKHSDASVLLKALLYNVSYDDDRVGQLK